MDEVAILAAQRSAYRTSFLAHGDTPKATLQNDRLTQHIRFANLIREISPFFESGTTIHDIGSGLCDFYEFLKQEGLDKNCTYSGTEIVDDMNKLARRKFPELTLSNRNILDSDVVDQYDFCVASGTFNLLSGVAEDDWRNLCYSLIEKMFRMSCKGIAFNILTSYRTFSDPTLCYFDPTSVFNFVSTRLSRFVSIHASGPLYEVTVTVLQKEFVASQFPQKSLGKYFR